MPPSCGILRMAKTASPTRNHFPDRPRFRVKHFGTESDIWVLVEELAFYDGRL